jgi:hypothetical protein
VWLIPTLEKFPRSQKFLLDDRIQTAALNVLESPGCVMMRAVRF